MKVGIVGYGNLGKALEKELKKHKDYELVQIFSRRKLPNAQSFSKIKNYIGKIETLFVCVGSQSDLQQTSLKLIKNFNIVETYDNHKKIPEYFKKINQKAKKYGKIAICSAGWDPGLFSFMRGLISSLGFEPITFWGKGVSQGHTQAIKNLPGVLDGIEFTLPNKSLKSKIKRGKAVDTSKLPLHSRLCYVVAEENDQARIKDQIKNMPDYFLGYKTTVKFVSQSKLDKLKTHSHCGEVLTSGNIINFSLKLSSNPEFTARVAACFGKSIKKLSLEGQVGAFSIFDLPLSYVINKNVFELL